MSVSPRKKMSPHGEGEKISVPGVVRTQDLRNRTPLLYQLSEKARWELTDCLSVALTDELSN